MFNENGPISNILETQNEIFKVREANQKAIASRQLNLTVELRSWSTRNTFEIESIESKLEQPEKLSNLESTFEEIFLPELIIFGIRNPEYEDRAIELQAMWLRMDSYEESRKRFENLHQLHDNLQDLKKNIFDFQVPDADAIQEERNEIKNLKLENNQEEYYLAFLKDLKKYPKGEYLKIIQKSDIDLENKNNEPGIKSILMNVLGRLLKKTSKFKNK